MPRVIGKLLHRSVRRAAGGHDLYLDYAAFVRWDCLRAARVRYFDHSSIGLARHLWKPLHVCKAVYGWQHTNGVSAEFRRQMVELLRAGRTPQELEQAFEPCAKTIRDWAAEADRDQGKRRWGDQH